MTLRSNLMTALRHEVKRWNVTQAEAAARLGISQPRLNKLVKGRFNEFRLDTLAELASKAGLTLRMTIAAPKPPPKKKRAAEKTPVAA
ncbi:helix-turn-helix domain-containing protein [Oleomonas cavernae]|uniref:Helix-turn-helix domain-containing protein n=1 Tax=Oleomonas cavernae TaxID=2320859 RepID=A0A418WUQ2_9PROT|nr:XRE family transcriptional regulator [Oleomonas cavernae]RJF94859.1 helix-turn-helix domain-containing protein [Oleomonas cavernae]